MSPARNVLSTFAAGRRQRDDNAMRTHQLLGQ